MRHAVYDVKISGEELQPVTTVSSMNPRYTDPAKYTVSFEASRLKSKLGSLQHGELYLVQNEFSAIDIASNGLKAVLVALHDDFGKARQESRTNVRFAQLVLEDQTHGQKAELVAVKYTSPTLAAREFAAMRFVNAADLSGLPSPASFTPLGFIRHPEDNGKSPKIGLITRYEHSVLTLDRVFWDKEHTPTKGELAHAFGVAAVWLARLHGNGIVHRDAQPKNIAYGNTDQPRYVDLESATTFKTKDGNIDYDQAKTYAIQDIECFLRHLDGDYTDMVSEHFAKPYIELTSHMKMAEVIDTSKDEIIAISKLDQEPIARFGAYT